MRVAIDFGTSNTVVARYDEATQGTRTLLVPEYGELLRQGEEDVALVPSLVHYGPDRRVWIGRQVVEQGLTDAPETFRWMKRYLLGRSPVAKRVHGRRVTPTDAATEFLRAVLLFAREQAGDDAEQLALTVPVEAYEDFEDWLGGVAEESGFPRYRLIDEPSAAALGYGTSIRAGDVYLVFDFGGGTLDVAVVLIDDDETGGRRCRVLGKSGAELGGAVLDGWLYQAVLERIGRHPDDDDVRRLSLALLSECRAAKERLSFEDAAEVGVVDPDSGAALGTRVTRSELEEVLDRHDAFARIDRTVRSALARARERGYDEDAVKAVLMVGGSSQIPAVQRTLRRIFGRERVQLHRPVDAVARGAAAFAAGVDFFDHIQHDYAIRYVDPAAGDYAYRTIVPKGTDYPTSEPVAALNVKATYDGQTQLGLAVFELGEGRRRGEAAPVELVFDPSGAARMVQLTPDELERRSRFWLNESSPTFLDADPPAKRGTRRFRIEFGIDANKRLLLTARDLETGRLTHRDFPVVKLS